MHEETTILKSVCDLVLLLTTSSSQRVVLEVRCIFCMMHLGQYYPVPDPRLLPRCFSYILSIFTRKHNKCRGRAIFKKFTFQTIMEKIFIDNRFLQWWFTDYFHFTTLLMGKRKTHVFNFAIVY